MTSMAIRTHHQPLMGFFAVGAGIAAAEDGVLLSRASANSAAVFSAGLTGVGVSRWPGFGSAGEDAAPVRALPHDRQSCSANRASHARPHDGHLIVLTKRSSDGVRSL